MLQRSVPGMGTLCQPLNREDTGLVNTYVHLKGLDLWKWEEFGLINSPQEFDAASYRMPAAEWKTGMHML